MAEVSFNRSFSLDNKTALITGAANGIGKAIAILLAEKNAETILVDKSDDVRNVAETIEKAGGHALPLVFDICEARNIDKIVSEGIKAFRKIDILVNNAGIGPLDDAENVKEEEWDRTIALNLKAPFMMAQAVGREMIRRRSGKIINIASQAALVALDKHVAYSASKAGLVGMTRVLALEWAEYNINVNCISPTVILTELGKRAWGGPAGETMKKKIPMGRFGQPEEVAACVLFLASDATNMITGENLSNRRWIHSSVRL